MVKRAISLILFFSLIFLPRVAPVSCAADTVVVTGEGEYTMGAGETMEVAEERARKAAMRAAAEKAGVFVKSYTQVKNLAVEADIIETVAEHAMKVRVLEKKKTPLGDLEAIKFYVKIEATLTAEEIEANLDKIRKDQGIADAYRRLKADYEKKDKEIERLKRQLETAVGGDRQRIARLISEEEKRYKANLWLERAEALGPFPGDEALKAYRKALEFDPDLAEAYVGMARLLKFQHMGEPQDKKGLEAKAAAMREILGYLDRALTLAQDHGPAYALRAEIKEELKKTEGNLVGEEGDEAKAAWEEKKGRYDEEILADLNRAIALEAPNKAQLYQRRAYLYVERAWRTKDERDFDQALADADLVIAMWKKKDRDPLSHWWRFKGNIYQNASHYYRYHQQDQKAAEMERLSEGCFQKARELAERELAVDKGEEDRMNQHTEALYQTDFGRLVYEILEGGWRDRVLGMSRATARAVMEGGDEAQKKKLEAQLEAKHREIKNAVASGKATAEEYLLLAEMFDPRDDDRLRQEHFERGIALLEGRNPRGREALFLVHMYLTEAGLRERIRQYDAALKVLSKAKAVVDAHLEAARKAVGLEDYRRLRGVMKGADEGTEGMDRMLGAVKALGREQAEGVFWITFALDVSGQKAQIYEKIDLPAQARREYEYLCREFKDEGACKGRERLR